MNRDYSPILRATGIALTALIGCATTSYAQPSWAESGDAGDLVGTAQNTLGSGALTTITGTLSSSPFFNGDPVDMYCINIPDPMAFSATLSPGSIQMNPLFLFNPSSMGITSQEGFYNQNGGPSRIGISVHPPAPGTYYLAIGRHDHYAFDSSFELIWQSEDGLEHPPNGLAGPLVSWGPYGGEGGIGPYTINLTGVNPCEVPEPATLSFFALGGALMLRRGRIRKGRNKG